MMGIGHSALPRDDRGRIGHGRRPTFERERLSGIPHRVARPRRRHRTPSDLFSLPRRDRFRARERDDLALLYPLPARPPRHRPRRRPASHRVPGPAGDPQGRRQAGTGPARRASRRPALVDGCTRPDRALAPHPPRTGALPLLAVAVRGCAARRFVYAIGEHRATAPPSPATDTRWQSDRRHKLIEYSVEGRRTTQLFDLAADPFEMHNLVDEPSAWLGPGPAHADTLARLRAEPSRRQEELDDADKFGMQDTSP